MVYLSSALWVLSCLGIIVLIFFVSKESRKRRKSANGEVFILSSGMTKLWDCLLIVLILMSRHTVLYNYLFSIDPNAAILGEAWAKYLHGIIYALVFPHNLLPLLGSFGILTANGLRMKGEEQRRRQYSFHPKVFISVCLCFAIVFTLMFLSYRLHMINAYTMYCVFIYGKAIALVLIISTLKEKKDNKTSAVNGS